MQTIKFKVWDKLNEYFHYLTVGEDVIPANEDFVFLQFTGLLDKNGVEIYEGDVIKITQHYYDCEDVDTHKAEVIFYENHSCFGYTSKKGNFSMLIGQGLEIEVIGNKYDVRI